MSALEAESSARRERTCAGCGRQKPFPEPYFAGCVVCWDCFKRHPIAPFKYFTGNFSEWLIAIKRSN